MTDEELREKVIRHDYEFKSLTTSLAELSDSMKQLTKGLEQVIVLNERMVSMDRDLKDSFKRVHTRQDEEEKKLDDFMHELELIRIMLRYPKLIGLCVIGAMALNIEPIRKIIFGG